MTKAFNFSLPGFELVNNTVADDENYDDGSESESDDCESEKHDSEDPAAMYDYLPEHHLCFIHTMQLVVKDGLEKAGNNLNKVLSKASKLVTYTRRSIKASDSLEGERNLQQQNATRWNSQLTMIRSILAVPKEKLDALDTVKLNVYERQTLQELCEMLRMQPCVCKNMPVCQQV